MGRRFELEGAAKTELYESVLRRASFRCENPLCRQREGIEVDHHVLRSQLGPDTLENLCVLCRPCHRLKASQVLVIMANGDGTFRFVDTRRAVRCEDCCKRILQGEVMAVPTPTGGIRWTKAKI